MIKPVATYKALAPWAARTRARYPTITGNGALAMRVNTARVSARGWLRSLFIRPM